MLNAVAVNVVAQAERSGPLGPEFGKASPVGLLVIVLLNRQKNPYLRVASLVIAMAVGYLLAACGPPVMGKIHDANGDWHIPLIAVALISVAMAIFGALAGRDREING